MTVSEIFESNGEDYFRNLEEKITLKSLKKIKSVISLGGGGFINDKIRKEILIIKFLLMPVLVFFENCIYSLLISN